jgi:hypothetical protein
MRLVQAFVADLRKFDMFSIHAQFVFELAI